MATDNTYGLTVTLPSDREIALTRAFDAPRDLVFEAFSKPEHLVHWYGPKGMTVPVCELDFRPGGAWHVVHRDTDGNEFGFRGEFRDIVPPERIARTFEFEGMPGHVAVETVNFEELDQDRGRTRITVTSVFESTEDRDGMLQSGMEQGASESYDRLADYLRTIA